MDADVDMHRGGGVIGLGGAGFGSAGRPTMTGRGRADSKDSVECWDDDPDFADIDDIPAPRRGAASPAFSRASTDHNMPDRRQSLCSSRMSIASTHDMEEVGDHELPLDDSPAAAIASAIRAGIPIPESVPPSALVGGTIKRLGGSMKGRRITAHDDWSEDLELPGSVNTLTVKKKEFSDAFDELMDGRRSGHISPFKLNLLPSASSQLDKFRDDDDDDFMRDFDEAPTLRIPRDRFNTSNIGRPPLPSPPLSEAPSRGGRTFDDDFDKDFEFPADAPLRLNLKAVEGQNSLSSFGGAFDDWSEIDSGIGGSYYDGGSRRDGSTNGDRMNPSHLMSPSMTAMTMESEDEMPMDGLVLPESGLPDLSEVMERRRRESMSPVKQEPVLHVRKDSDDVNDGFFDGIEIGDGEIFDTRKLTLNRNVKQKDQPRKKSPTRRTAMSLTFTTNSEKLNTPRASATRSHKVSQSQNSLPSQLEPVAERENPPSTVKRRNRWSSGAVMTENNRFSGNESHPPTTSANPMSRLERERSVGKKPSTRGIKNENTAPTTTNAQLLRAKRSIPSMSKPGTSQTKTQRQQVPPVPTRTTSNRPSSRTSGGRPPSASASTTGRPSSSSANSSGRPTTNAGSRPPSSGGNVRPGSRSSQGRPSSRTEPATVTRSKTPANNRNSFQQRPPFNAGGSTMKSYSTKPTRRSLDRNDIERLEKRPASRLQQRTAMTPRHSPSSSGASTATAKKSSPLVAPEHLRREAASAMTQPTRKRNFGDGTELEQFDDLPTNTKQESKFTVAPVGRGAPKCLQGPTGTIKAKNVHSRTDSKDEPQKKKIDRTLRSRVDLKSDSNVPSYLRDTAASRNAREITQQRLNMVAANTPLPTSPTADRWRSQIAARSSVMPRTGRKKPQTKPHLIRPMGSINTVPKEAAATGMTYNPRTMQWDGNEKDLAAFDAPEPPPAVSSSSAQKSPPRQPALITKVNTTASAVVQVVGGMVFDPARMCWLKVDEDPDDDEGDPFEGVEDIPADDLMSTENQSVAGLPGGNNSIIMGGTSNFGGLAGGPPRLSGGFGEFVVGEEFDVGPQFVARQKEEEERWRKVVEGWVAVEPGGGSAAGGTDGGGGGGGDSERKWENRYLLRELLADPAMAAQLVRR